MDNRIALKKDTELRFFNFNHGICTYNIQEELARGASGIVYNAFYINNAGVSKAVRIKECYPFTLDIRRGEDGSLQADDSDRENFENRKRKMKMAFDLGNELFATGGLTNFISNSVDIYEYNNTVYIAMAYQEGTTLSYDSFSSLKDCIRVVKSTSKVIAKIHNKGYLYLDIKPENVFSLASTTEVIQLFDFDSLIPISELERELEDCEYKISYTKGFAALELQTGSRRRLGKHTDVYSIGAILFYLIFGRCPAAPDCDMDADYDYAGSKYAIKTFQDKLYSELTDFFHSTLADYHLDRYQNMNQVIAKLEEIEKLADAAIPYIRKHYIAAPKLLIGRKEEACQIDQWMQENKSRVLFIGGMGGIGKTTMVRGYFSEKAQEYDTVLSLNYQDSLKRTIIDDRQFHINAVEQRPQEDLDAYFYRKISIAKDLSKDKKTVFIIDNYSGNDLDGLEELIHPDWTILFLTRNHLSGTNYDSMEVGPVRRRSDLYRLFEAYLRHSVDASDYDLLDRIIDNVQGHTLILELIAKQMENSYLTIEEADHLIREHGCLKLAPEKVTYRNQRITVTDNIQNIIEEIFSSSKITKDKYAVLKSIAYFGTNGISVDAFSKIYGLDRKDLINELASEGWITIHEKRIDMHPVIIESMCARKNTEQFEQAVNSMLLRLKEMLTEDKDALLPICEEFLRHCQSQPGFRKSAAYKELLFLLLVSMPRYREDDILEAAVWLSRYCEALDHDSVIRLYDRILEIYEERQELEQAYACISQAEKWIKSCDDSHIKGEYYYMLVGFYDDKLDGWYAVTNREQAETRKALMKSLNKAIGYMKRSKRPEGALLLAEYLRCKANLLIRSNPRARRRIDSLLHKVERILDRQKQEDTELAASYFLTRAWYYVYVEPDEDMVRSYIARTYRIDLKITETDLDLIDNLLIPAANMFLEIGSEEEAVIWLTLGLQICSGQEEFLPYIRKKMELYTYLLDVYRYTENTEQYHKTADLIREVNEQYKRYGIFMKPEE